MTVFALSVLKAIAMSCISKIQFFLHNSSFGRNYAWPCLWFGCPIHCFTTACRQRLLELGRMRNGVRFQMDPLAKPIRSQQKCWESAASEVQILWYATALCRIAITRPDSILRMRVGMKKHYSWNIQLISALRCISQPPWGLIRWVVWFPKSVFWMGRPPTSNPRNFISFQFFSAESRCRLMKTPALFAK